jgi:hypothetical protein
MREEARASRPARGWAPANPLPWGCLSDAQALQRNWPPLCESRQTLESFRVRRSTAFQRLWLSLGRREGFKSSFKSGNELNGFVVQTRESGHNSVGIVNTSIVSTNIESASF